MPMLDGMRTVFLEALSFVDEGVRATLVKQWNEQCEEVYRYKKALIAEEQAKASAYGKVVAREIFDEVHSILEYAYNWYVFGDNDYAQDDVAVECAMNFGTDVSNRIEELKKKYTEDKP